MTKQFLLISTIIIYLLSFTAAGSAATQIASDTLNVKQQMKPTGKLGFSLGSIPLYFIPNKGQTDAQVHFYAKASRYTLWVTDKGLVFDSRIPVAGEQKRFNRDVTGLNFLNANKKPVITALDESDHRVSFYNGKDSSKWQTNMATSKAILYSNIYNNIDLKIYGIEKEVEYDWMVKPGGDPNDIRFQLKHVRNTTLDKEGNLIIETALGTIKHKKPFTYQTVNGNQITVASRFVKTGQDQFKFEIGSYDKALKLFIDPIVMYSTYLGGIDPGTNLEYYKSSFIKSDGLVYITGNTIVDDFPVSSDAYQNVPANPPGYQNACGFISVIDTTKKNADSLVYSTYLGGGYADSVNDIKVDNAGNIYVTGNAEHTSNSTYKFPSNLPAIGTLGMKDIYIAKFNYISTQPTTYNLDFSILIGGTKNDYGDKLAIDVNDTRYVYVSGKTLSSETDNFPVQPTLNGYDKTKNAGLNKFDYYMLKFDTITNTLAYCTYVWGDDTVVSSDHIQMTAATGGVVYLAGIIKGGFLPLTGTPTYQGIFQGGTDGFISIMDTNQTGSSSLLYSTYFGGSVINNTYGGDDQILGIFLKDNKDLYVSGMTNSSDFPTSPNAYLNENNEFSHMAFISKFENINPIPSSVNLAYSSYFGGTTSTDRATAIFVDNIGLVWLGGETKGDNNDFPLKNEGIFKVHGEYDSFLSILDLTQGAEGLRLSLITPGSNDESTKAVGPVSTNHAVIVSSTLSSSIGTHEDAFQQNLKGEKDAFITRLQMFKQGPDFNGDGTVDILWRYHGTGGSNVLWLRDLSYDVPDVLADSLDHLKALQIEPVANLAWQIAGTGDFNYDGTVDILFRNTEPADKRAIVWYMKWNPEAVGSEKYQRFYVADLGAVNLKWSVSGTGDFNYDGKVDIMWHDAATGTNVVWYMDGENYTVASLPTTALIWEPRGTGDFNNDGKVDIIWRHVSDGRTVVWYMNGLNYIEVHEIKDFYNNRNTNYDWILSTNGDYNNDGYVDLVWQNSADGRIAIWYLKNVTTINQEVLTTVSDLTWKIE